MKSKIALINYAGYPLYVSSLMPESGLATLAGQLINKGYETIIEDFAKVDIISELLPKKLSSEFSMILDEINNNIKSDKVISKEIISELHLIENKINEFREKKIDNFSSRINNIISKKNIDFLGFKLFIGDGFKGSIKIAEKIKEKNPDIMIFGGGPQVDLFRDMIYTRTNVFDSLSIGEADNSIVKLAEYCDGKKNINQVPNLLFKKKGRLYKTKTERVHNLDELKIPSYDIDVYPQLKGDNKIKIFYLDESRGCPYSCNFCLHPLKSGKFWRYKSPNRIVEEIKEIIKKFGTGAFRFAGSNTPHFLNNKIAQEIVKNELEIKYSCFGHVGKYDYDYFNILKKAGCVSIFFGVESGSQIILDKSINKKVSVDDIVITLKQAKNSGLFVVASLIMPSPLETEKTKQETYDIIKKSNPSSCVLTVPLILKGTEWYQNNEAYNIKIDSKEKLLASFMNYQAKFSFPTQLWNEFPYKVNDKNFSVITQESNQFGIKLSRIGINLDITDEIYLMSLYTDYSPIEFRDISREHILKGDFRKIKNLVKEINKNLLTS